MLGLAFAAVCAALLAGLAVKLVLDRMDNPYEITWREFGVGSLVIALLAAPITTVAGWNIAKADKLSFNEYWNGYELRADWQRIPCSRDGPCIREYSCDPYIDVHTRTVTDSDGNSHTETYTETHWHDCPYTTEEWTFTIATTIGDYLIAEHWLPTNPDANRWRATEGIPGNIPSGIPAFWLQVKERIDAGAPGPVTKRMQYDNYILASDKSILRQYSDKIESFKKQGLLPPVVTSVRDFYYADKVSFVGFSPANKTEWQETLMRLNAALGTELQGDLHLIVVQNASITAEKDAYITALKAYWSDPETFGDQAISKNSIIVVIGTEDGSTVSWARATTGMPQGNEYMLVAIQNRIAGAPLTPQAVLGVVRGEFYWKEKDGEKKLKVRGLHGNGALENILWGLDDPATKFQRVSMTSNDSDDIGGGFLYLNSEIEPTDGAKALIVIAGFIISMLVWVAFVIIDERNWLKNKKRRPNPRDDNSSSWTFR